MELSDLVKKAKTPEGIVIILVVIIVVVLLISWGAGAFDSGDEGFVSGFVTIGELKESVGNDVHLTEAEIEGIKNGMKGADKDRVESKLQEVLKKKRDAVVGKVHTLYELIKENGFGIEMYPDGGQLQISPDRYYAMDVKSMDVKSSRSGTTITVRMTVNTGSIGSVGSYSLSKDGVWTNGRISM